MIQCSLRQLEARCRQRGYTLEEVRPCIASEDGDRITVDVDHPAYPREPKPGFVPTKPREPEVSLLQKAKNFAVSAANHVASGARLAGDEEVAMRFAICQTCEHYDGNACLKCGCPVVREKKFISKLSWANEKCPAGKW
jgi:hypothetical protein